MSTSYSGTSLPDLIGTVDNVLAIHSARLNAVEFLKHACLHLPAEDDGDMAALVLMEEFQFCIDKDLTRLCSVCGEMEGLHSHWGDFCRDQRNPRYGTFQGVVVVSNTFEPFPDGRKA